MFDPRYIVFDDGGSVAVFLFKKDAEAFMAMAGNGRNPYIKRVPVEDVHEYF